MKRPIQIVNDDDELVGHIQRAEADYGKIIYRVSGLWLTNSKGEVLIALRKKTKASDPGKWGPAVAGTLEDDDTYESNIYQEAHEEIGLDGVTFELGPKVRIAGPRNYFCQWFKAEVDKPAEDFVLQEEEVEAIRWISEADLVDDVKSNPDKYLNGMSKELRDLGVSG